MNFTTMFLYTRNVHLLKDVGMIPYLMHKEYNCDSNLVTYENGAYPYLEKEVSGLKLQFLKKGFPGDIWKGCSFLKQNAKNIDVFNVYHLNLTSFFWLSAYKKYKKTSGLAYLKLDMDYNGLSKVRKKNLVGMIKRKTVQLSDIASAETKEICQELKKMFGEKIIYIPNGYYLPEGEKSTGEAEAYHKENTILTVGNLGSFVKATDILLEAFEQSSKNHEWNLRLIGPIAMEFVEYRRKFYKQNPHLRDRVVFTGPIRDKEQLRQEYRKAKVFVLPSRSESFGIALSEAISQGCYIVTTDTVPAGKDISNGGKFGRVVPNEDVDALAKVFTELYHSKEDYDSLALQIESYAAENFNWGTIISRLYHSFEEKEASEN